VNPVADYCARFKASGLDVRAFARRMLIREPDLCLRVLETIGSWPSSEPELAALQSAFGNGA
jgi:hypothetical protein